MDYYKFIPCLILVTIQCVLTAHIPEVREEYENYNPTVFNFKEYQKATQQDPQTLRYKQQQQSDKFNIPISINRQERYVKIPTYEPEAVKVPKQRDSWKVIHPKFVNENQRDDVPYESPQINEKITLDDVEEKFSSTPKSKITKKSLKPNSYDGKFSRKQDNNYLYENSNGKKVYQQNAGGFSNHEQLKALNALLGQTPNIQLQGLQQLLGNRLKDHTPIKEEVVDIPNNQNKPNIKVQHNHNIANAVQNNGNNPDSFKNLQAQLDATANAHAESIIAQAQQKALEHVKAQHAAIAKVQADAEKQALRQVQAQNEALQRAHAEAESRRQAELQAEENARLLVEKEKSDEEKRKIEERRRIADIARERARASALAFKLKQEREKAAEIKSDILQQDAQKTRNINKQKKKVPHQESAETQHYYTHQLPQIQQAYSHIDPQIVHIEPKHQHHHQQPIKHTEHHEEADVTKYFIPPQITTHEGKNEHGEHEVSKYFVRIKRDENDINDASTEAINLNEEYAAPPEPLRSYVHYHKRPHYFSQHKPIYKPIYEPPTYYHGPISSSLESLQNRHPNQPVIVINNQNYPSISPKHPYKFYKPRPRPPIHKYKKPVGYVAYITHKRMKIVNKKVDELLHKLGLDEH